MNMDIRPLRTEADYDWALAEIEPYFINPPPVDTAEAERFDVLAMLIEAYEARHWPIDPPDPVDAIRARMELSDYTQADLARLLGSRSRASEILARRRGLTMEQAYRLHREWHIPAEALIRPVQGINAA
ncbi:MAG TPA: XRE family transcriptional regulator [Rhodopila sp.]|nr:XRE family transcriptional regulator [Rhodopila sp.]